MVEVSRKEAIRAVLRRIKSRSRKAAAPLPELFAPTVTHPAAPTPEPVEREEVKARAELGRIPLPRIFVKPLKAREDVLAHLRRVKEIYPLITTTWRGRTYSVVSARIQFDPKINQLRYTLVEPILDTRLRKVIHRTIALLHDRLEIDFSKLKAKKEVYEYVDDKINEIWRYLGLRLSDEDTIKTKYYIFRDTIGLGKIEGVMRDPNIEDVGCDGIRLPLFIFHRNPLYGEMPTNIRFDAKDELDSFVMRLAQKCNRTVSVAAPLLDAALPDGSRIQITYGTDIARKGSNFSIRKFFRVPLTPVDLMNYDTVDALILAYLWLIIEEQQSALIAGSTASGKTTFLNSSCLFINPTMKIVSIEDTAELQLIHTNWMPQVARAGFGPKKYGEVTMYDLLKAALRQRPDYIIVGEVRGKEANVMFHAMATGHPSLSTLHADNVEAVIDRLTTRPISLPLSLLENLDVIVFLEKVKKAGRFSRRVSQIIEIEGYDRERDRLKTNIAFEWLPYEDRFVGHNSMILARIARRLGWGPEEVKDELLRRAYVLNWMKEKSITNFKDVAHIINLYYVDPKRLAHMMEA